MLPIHLQMTLLLSARQRCYNLMGEFRKYYSKSDIFLTEMTMLEMLMQTILLDGASLRYKLGL